MSGHRGAGGATVLALNDLAELLYRHLVAAHLDESAHDGAHHVAQESVGSDGKHPLVVLTGPLGMGDAAVVGLDVGVQLRKRGEVGVVQQTACRLVHQIEVKVGRTFPAQRVAERVLMGYRKIFVGAAGGIKTCVSIVMNGGNAIDGNVGWQQSVQAVNQAVEVGDGLLGVEMSHHQSGIYSGIGAACPRHRRGHTQQRGHRLLDGLLHRRVLGLHLPPMVACPPITQPDKVSHLSFLVPSP